MTPNAGIKAATQKALDMRLMTSDGKYVKEFHELEMKP